MTDLSRTDQAEQTDQVRRWTALRESAGPIEPTELDDLWAALAPVDAGDILGQWRGFAFPTGHRMGRLLVRSRWYGKRFVALDDAVPLLCVGPDGELFSDVESGRGLASLWNVEFRGEVTATMVYDGMAVLDHFKKVDDRTLMGIMNGKPGLVLDNGRHFYFGLERD
ncbi:DUF4334 domain-containing protein [Parafrankia sp. EUN1f]|uniref:DUF4334 domain-containing protein n=1 Tax=Parafrankia sp. EUN1f TaxID=102897 RepID=UPI0001C44725|nr:DUF4334 domain-containing protein [Parafrankia sp. EUN1f]EFC83376.1 conserved hypothetical protein [Parafrankia sp. EUN1f]